MFVRVLTVCFVAGIAATAYAFSPVEIISVRVERQLPEPIHHGLAIKIKPIIDANLASFKVEVSSDAGRTWRLFSDSIKPYNSDTIILPYRSDRYGLQTDKDYTLRLCALYGGNESQCALTQVRLSNIVGDNSDLDDDGLPKQAEYAAGTDPLNPDSDYDDMSDRVEFAYQLDPSLTQLPSLELAVDTLQFGTGNAFGDRPGQHQKIILRNIGERPLRIFNILIQQDMENVFLASEQYRFIREIPPHNETSFSIDYLPNSPMEHHGQIDILSDDRAHYPASIELEGQGRNIANLEVEYNEPYIEFGNVSVGDSVNGPNIIIRNRNSDTTLKVSSFVAYTLNIFTTPQQLELGPEGIAIIRTRFFPDWSGTYEGILKIQGENDSTFKIVNIPIRANVAGKPPQMRVEPSGLRFFRPGTEKSLIVYNDGDGYLFVKHMDFGGDTGNFETSSRQIVVPPRSNRPVRIRFVANDGAVHQSQLCIVSNDPGIGVVNGCDVVRTVGNGLHLPREALRIPLTGGR